MRSALLLFSLVGLAACSSDEPSASDAGAGAGAGRSDAGGVTPATGCDASKLRTGLVAKQTGVNVDAFDCAILAATAKYHEPDPMIFKAIIYVESRFDRTSVACPNLPCNQPAGWTNEESRCYGLMQIVPACNSTPKTVLLSNGHPNLTTDTSAVGYAGSVFNPDVNIDVGVSGIAGNRGQVVEQFPGCTTDQYTMMAIGNYNSYGSTKSCTQINGEYTKIVLEAYREYSQAAGYVAHAY
ncbi:MAG: transglycosylase SLT domain-containing protein [Labilithrix sp.]